MTLKKKLKFLVFLFLILINIYFISGETWKYNYLPELEQTTNSVNYSEVNVNNSNYLDGYDSSYFYPASNPNSYITDGNTNWDNFYGFWDTLYDDWLFESGTTLGFNSSKLSTVYYNATQGINITGTTQGSIINTQHPNGHYDDVSFNITEQASAPALDVRVNFTDGITDFNNGIIRYRTEGTAGDEPIIQLWDYDDGEWEDYPSLTRSDTWVIIEQSVFDSDSHVQDGVVQMRVYKEGNGNINNKYFVDWLAVTKGFGAPAGMEVDPYSIHTDHINTTQMNYTDMILNIKTDWLFNLFLNRSREIDYLSTYNSTYDAYDFIDTNDSDYIASQEGNWRSTFNVTYDSNVDTNDSGYIASNEGSWLSTYNSTYDNSILNEQDVENYVFDGDTENTNFAIWKKRFQVPDLYDGNSADTSLFLLQDFGYRLFDRYNAYVSIVGTVTNESDWDSMFDGDTNTKIMITHNNNPYNITINWTTEEYLDGIAIHYGWRNENFINYSVVIIHDSDDDGIYTESIKCTFTNNDEYSNFCNIDTWRVVGVKFIVTASGDSDRGNYASISLLELKSPLDGKTTGYFGNVANNNDWYGNNVFLGGLESDNWSNVTLTVSQISDYIGGGNTSWNQSYANTLYSSINWGYNQTIPANSYTDNILLGYTTSGTSDAWLIKYQNITNLPTCSGTDKLTYDGTILSCDTDAGAGIESDPLWSSNFTNMQVDCGAGNAVYGIHPDGSFKCRLLNDTQTINNRKYMHFSSAEISMSTDSLYMGLGHASSSALDESILTLNQLNVTAIYCAIETVGLGAVCNFTLYEATSGTPYPDIGCAQNEGETYCVKSNPIGSIVLGGDQLTIDFEEVAGSCSGHAACTIAYYFLD